jgi:6-phosphogluconolactonase
MPADLRLIEDVSLEALAHAVARRIATAIRARGRALIAVSGGKSPAALFDRLAGEALDWGKVVVAQVDERWVDHADPASNSRLVREHLLKDRAAAARFVPMWNGAPSAAEGQPACEAALRELPRPFDFMLLGMGEDGHTASLFPHAPELAHALATEQLCAAATATVAPHERMTLTLAGLTDSRLLILSIAGAAKKKVLATAMAAGPVEEMPVRAILRQEKAPVELWLSD